MISTLKVELHDEATSKIETLNKVENTEWDA